MAWQVVAQADSVSEDEALGVQIGKHDIALCRVGGEIHAIHNICSHQYARLSDGYVEDGCIECPLHQGRFEIATGKAMGAPVTVNVKVYPVKVEGGQVLVDFGEAGDLVA